MKRFHEMDWYRRFLLMLLPLLIIVFSIIYFWTLRKWGFEYVDSILVKSEANGSVVYSGEVNNKETVFTVTGNTVKLSVAGKDVGTYTYVEDPSFILESKKDEPGARGIVIYKDGKEFFRATGNGYGQLFTDDEHSLLVGDNSTGVADGDNPAKPLPVTIYLLMNEPELIHHGYVGFWILGTLTAIAFEIMILFAEELFNFDLSLSVKDHTSADPTALEEATWYVRWGFATILIIMSYVIGLMLPPGMW